jgi:site-specific DNA recombinase
MVSVAHPSTPTRRSPNGLSLTTSGLRVAVYVRVSTEEQLEGYSLDAQRRAADLYCEGHGWTVVRTYADEGKSARTDDLQKRPEFRAMLADAEAGLVDVVLVHKLDRFARNLRVTLETLERLERCRVAFASIAENMDFTSPIGKVILATLAAFAQYYSDNLSWETKKGKQERKEQGLYNGHLPYGIKKSREGLPVPDPDTYPACCWRSGWRPRARAIGMSPTRSTPPATG